MRNASLAFGFLTRNSSLGELCILHIQNRWEMLFRGIVKNYTADLILRTKFKKIIGMKEKFAQNMEVPVSLMEFLLQTQGSFGKFFCLKFYILQCFQRNRTFKAILFDFEVIKLEIKMCFYECISQCVSLECVSANVLLICFQFHFLILNSSQNASKCTVKIEPKLEEGSYST